MTRFLKWRKMTWALLLWGALIGVWMVSGASALTFMAGAFGLIVLSAMCWAAADRLHSQALLQRCLDLVRVHVSFLSS